MWARNLSDGSVRGRRWSIKSPKSQREQSQEKVLYTQNNKSGKGMQRYCSPLTFYSFHRILQTFLPEYGRTEIVLVSFTWATGGNAIRSFYFRGTKEVSFSTIFMLLRVQYFTASNFISKCNSVEDSFEFVKGMGESKEREHCFFFFFVK